MKLGRMLSVFRQRLTGFTRAMFSKKPPKTRCDMPTVTLELTDYQLVQLRHAVAQWASSRYDWRMERLQAGDDWAAKPNDQEIAAGQLADIVWSLTDSKQEV
jgi:hypothetical protein